uniref:Uncharacterized protein n=1 Tax=Glossina pallidipes TaxID=7398 RepID=A0A1A9Z1N6_GLOPL
MMIISYLEEHSGETFARPQNAFSFFTVTIVMVEGCVVNNTLWLCILNFMFLYSTIYWLKSSTRIKKKSASARTCIRQVNLCPISSHGSAMLPSQSNNKQVMA